MNLSGRNQVALWASFRVAAAAVVVDGGDAAAAQRGDEQLAESASEQPTHGAVEQEVDGTVDDDDHVPDVTQLRVDVDEDALVDAAEERQDALRQFGNDEAEDHGDEHRRGSVVLACLLRLHPASLHLQQATTAVGASHRHDQQRAEHRQQHARHHLQPTTAHHRKIIQKAPTRGCANRFSNLPLRGLATTY